ncbi:hypothetical protein [Lysobacter gummosus]|uniref:hypothetical protein n=1 Tax=Lysobacter gummosus TaxID=262324 RepID=UPI00363481CF
MVTLVGRTNASKPLKLRLKVALSCIVMTDFSGRLALGRRSEYSSPLEPIHSGKG